MSWLPCDSTAGTAGIGGSRFFRPASRSTVPDARENSRQRSSLLEGVLKIAARTARKPRLFRGGNKVPIYDYRCADCGHVAELLVREAGSTPVRCPSCQGERIERLPSAARMVSAHRTQGSTCCGREERCETPPCSSGGGGCCGG